MAQQDASDESVKWGAGSKCDVFDRQRMEWAEALIIGSHFDDRGKWVKVRYEGGIRNIRSIDPDLRSHDILSNQEMDTLRHFASQKPEVTPILNRLLEAASGAGLHSYSDSLVVAFKRIIAHCDLLLR